MAGGDCLKFALMAVPMPAPVLSSYAAIAYTAGVSLSHTGMSLLVLQAEHISNPPNIVFPLLPALGTCPER